MNYNIRQRKISPEININNSETKNNKYNVKDIKQISIQNLLPKKINFTNSIATFFSSEKID